MSSVPAVNQQNNVWTCIENSLLVQHEIEGSPISLALQKNRITRDEDYVFNTK